MSAKSQKSSSKTGNILLAVSLAAGTFAASAAIASADQECWQVFKKGVNKPGDLCTESGSLQNDRDRDRENAALSAKTSRSKK